MDKLNFSHGGNIYEIKRKLKKEIIDFSANINPLGLPYLLKRHLYKNMESILHYPDPEAKNLVKKISEYWKIKEENILIGNGSIELIYLLLSTFKPKTTFIPVPTFSEYERAARAVNSKINYLELKENEGFRLNLLIFSKADMFLICNPNNPTGNLILEDIETVKRLPCKLLVVDEAFMDFLPDENAHTVIWKAVKEKNIVAIRTFTKIFALAGLRIGYLIAHKDIINKLKGNLAPWNTNSLAQLAAEFILNKREYIKKTYKLIKEERKFLFKELDKIEGLKTYPSVANFILIKIEKAGLFSNSLRKLLIPKGFLIRDCSNFRNLNDKYIRIAVRSHSENLKFIAGLKEVL